MEVTCFQCQKTNSIANKIHFRDECEHCGQDLHVCKQCQHYDVSSYNECKEPSADRILEKEKANYCDYFLSGTGSSDGASQKKDDLLAQAEALFKKK